MYLGNRPYKPKYVIGRGVGVVARVLTSQLNLPGANRREARKLGLLLSSKSSEAERERMEPPERNKRVCGDIPTQVLILMENPG